MLSVNCLEGRNPRIYCLQDYTPDIFYDTYKTPKTLNPQTFTKAKSNAAISPQREKKIRPTSGQFTEILKK